MSAGQGDVLQRMRTDTAGEHQDVERALGLMDAGLTRERLIEVLARLHGFWCAAEDGLDAWVVAEPEAAADVEWSGRHRAALYAADLVALGGPPDASGVPAVAASRPRLPAVPDTDAALGRLYVLEGSTLGGVFIDRHLAGLPHLASVVGCGRSLPTARRPAPGGAGTGRWPGRGWLPAVTPTGWSTPRRRRSLP